MVYMLGTLHNQTVFLSLKINDKQKMDLTTLGSLVSDVWEQVPPCLLNHSRADPPHNSISTLGNLRTLRVPSDLPTSMSSCSYQMRFVLEKVVLRLRHRRQRGNHRCLDQGRLLHGRHGVTKGFEGGRWRWMALRWFPRVETATFARTHEMRFAPFKSNWSWNCRNFEGRYFSFWGGRCWKSYKMPSHDGFRQYHVCCNFSCGFSCHS